MIAIEPVIPYLIEDISCSVLKGALPSLSPWESERFKLWSLWEMLNRFIVGDFSAILLNLERVICFYETTLKPGPPDKAILLPQNLQRYIDSAGAILQACEQAGVGLSLAVGTQLKRFQVKVQYAINNPEQADYADLTSQARMVRQSVIDELGEHAFVYLPQARQRYYDAKSGLFGKEVEDKFPDVTTNIREASYCFAFGRWTACVFHLMCVLEIGLRKVAADLGVRGVTPDFDRKTMGEIIKLCRNAVNTALQAKTIDKDGRDFYDAALGYLESAKNAWRNYTDHSKQTYDEEEAERILRSVDSFMRQIAKK